MGSEVPPRELLVAEGVRKVYRSGTSEVVALHDLDLRVDAGELVAVRWPARAAARTRPAAALRLAD